MPVDRIPHTALHARFEEKDTKAKPDNAGYTISMRIKRRFDTKGNNGLYK